VDMQKESSPERSKSVRRRDTRGIEVEIEPVQGHMAEIYVSLEDADADDTEDRERFESDSSVDSRWVDEDAAGKPRRQRTREKIKKISQSIMDNTREVRRIVTVKRLQEAAGNDSLFGDYGGEVGKRIKRAVLMIIGGVWSWAMGTRIEHNVIAASSVGIVVGLVEPRYGAPVYTAAFAGMASNKVITDGGYAVLMGALVVVFFELFAYFKIAEGFGGRLGMIAQLAVSCTVGIQLGSNAIPTQIYWDTSLWDVIEKDFWLPALICTPFGAVMTMYFRMNLKTVTNPVTASALTGLIVGGAWLTFNDYTACQENAGAAGHSDYKAWAANVALYSYCGSFIGMSTNTRIPNYPAFFLTGVITGAVNIAFAGFLNEGWGGKLGTTCLISVAIFVYLIKPFWPVHEEATDKKEEGGPGGLEEDVEEWARRPTMNFGRLLPPTLDMDDDTADTAHPQNAPDHAHPVIRARALTESKRRQTSPAPDRGNTLQTAESAPPAPNQSASADFEDPKEVLSV